MAYYLDELDYFGSSPAGTVTFSGSVATFAAAVKGAQAVTLWAVDAAGIQSVPVTTTVTVANAAPVAENTDLEFVMLPRATTRPQLLSATNAFAFGRPDRLIATGAAEIAVPAGAMIVVGVAVRKTTTSDTDIVIASATHAGNALTLVSNARESGVKKPGLLIFRGTTAATGVVSIDLTGTSPSLEAFVAVAAVVSGQHASPIGTVTTAVETTSGQSQVSIAATVPAANRLVLGFANVAGGIAATAVNCIMEAQASSGVSGQDATLALVSAAADADITMTIGAPNQPTIFTAIPIVPA